MSNVFVSFRYSVEYAVQLVALMKLSEKIKAVELWNSLSEDIQDIVNKSAVSLNNMDITVENVVSLSESVPTPLCDADTKKSVLPNLSSLGELKKFSDYYVLSAVIDLPKGSESTSPNIQFLDDHAVSTENEDTVASDVSKENEKPAETNKLSESVPKLPTDPALDPESTTTDKPLHRPHPKRRGQRCRLMPPIYTQKKGEYACDMCVKKFRNASTLHSHRAMHLGTYACKICNKWFSSKGTLSFHTRSHTGEKPYQCKVCKKNFAGKTSRRIHMRTHTGERPYVCKECGKTFTQSSVLKDHLDLHYNRKNFKCDVCEESFFRRHSLNAHRRRIHGKWNDKQKVFKCGSCEEFFFSKNQLDNHTGVHINGIMAKPFVCEVCKTCFLKQKSLEEHFNIHKGLKPFECKHCSAKFPTRNVLIRHRETQHRDKMKIKDKEATSDELPKKRKRDRKIKVKDEVADSLSETVNQPTSKIGPQIFAVVMDPETASLQMGNQALLYNPETQETIPAGDNMESVLEAINSLSKTSVETS